MVKNPRNKYGPRATWLDLLDYLSDQLNTRTCASSDSLVMTQEFCDHRGVPFDLVHTNMDRSCDCALRSWLVARKRRHGESALRCSVTESLYG